MLDPVHEPYAPPPLSPVCGKSLPPFIIRSAVPDDTDALAALLREGYGEGLSGDYHPNVLSAALPVISQPKDALVRSGTYFVADSGAGRLLGAGGWSWSGPLGGVPPRDCAHMRHVVVGRGFKGRGIGRLLLGHARASARRAGVSRLLCLSTISAAGFYEAQGFSRQGEVALSLQPGLSFPAVQMEGPA
ncbi:GNAT family N-acetyltransferase [Celeribacter arenosi]|uniref:GNAT family N-acetyltransferase n=1 Tax=Celeribacter arenosi TaxID=792649 RepID=A0ABP7JT81_9RHOB